LLNKRPDTNPIVLDDIDPSSEWVEETHSTEFDLDDLGWMGLDDDPLVAPGMAGTSVLLLLVLKLSLRSPLSELEDDLVFHVEDPISSSGDEFDD
jgi:hypothetical protein